MGDGMIPAERGGRGELRTGTVAVSAVQSRLTLLAGTGNRARDCRQVKTW